MEEKDLAKLQNDFVTVLNTVSALEQKLAKNEQLLLATFSYLYNKIDEVSQLNELKELRSELENLKNEKSKEQTKEIQQTKPKRKRPWNYFFIKRKLYKELLNKKHELEAEIDRKHQERLEEQKRQEELIRKEKERKQKELEEQRLKRRKESQQKINEILMKINKK